MVCHWRLSADRLWTWFVISPSQCVDKRGERFVGLIRVRYIVVKGGEYSSYAMSILPLPFSDYLPFTMRGNPPAASHATHNPASRTTGDATLAVHKSPTRQAQAQRFPVPTVSASSPPEENDDDDRRRQMVAAGVMVHNLPRERGSPSKGSSYS